MLMIRFQRIGRKNDASFRIAVLEKQSGPKAGKYVEQVGSYHPRTKETNLNADSIKKWISQGAQVSPTVHNLLVTKGVLEGKKKNVLPKKTAPVKEAEVVAEAPAPAPEAPVEEVAPEVTEAPAEEAATEPAPEAPAEEAAPAAE